MIVLKSGRIDTMAVNERAGIRAYTKFIGYTAISTIFFSILAILIGFSSLVEIAYFGRNMFAAIFFLFGIISFLGGALFLYKTGNEDHTWYFRIPLVITIAIVALSSFFSPALQVQGVLLQFPDLGVINAFVGSCAFILLAPFSALFLHSLKAQGEGVMSVHVVISLMASILSVIMFTGLLLHDSTMFPCPNDSLFGLGYWLYLIFGMPAVGAMFLATANRFQNNMR